MAARLEQPLMFCFCQHPESTQNSSQSILSRLKPRWEPGLRDPQGTFRHIPQGTFQHIPQGTFRHSQLDSLPRSFILSDQNDTVLMGDPLFSGGRILWTTKLRLFPYCHANEPLWVVLVSVWDSQLSGTVSCPSGLMSCSRPSECSI